MPEPARRAVTLLAVPLLLSGLTACGGDDKPRVRIPDAGPTCRTQGTVQAKPAASLEAAVEPFRQAGEELRISEKLNDAATVQLKDGKIVKSVVTLVRTGEGWVATSVSRC